jgi:hypothetical protein
MKLKKSPFKVNRIESNPDAFGLRYKEIISCCESLYNNRSVLISGPRGIGKSSLGNQLQKALEGDRTLLERCGINNTFPKTLCLFYACDSGNSLQQLVLDILYNLEQKCLLLPDSKIAFEINLGVIKASLESEVKRQSPATLATQLVSGLKTTINGLKKVHLYQAINIMLDEIDQIAENINFGHFLKIVHEALQNESITVNFILAGQQGIFSRLIKEDPSFERIVRHVPLTVLEPESSEYVLDYASHIAKPPFQYETKAKNLILGLASGYPYVLHLLGDSAYMEMENDSKMKQSDVINGIENILHSDKREKYAGYLRRLKDAEKIILMTLGRYETKTIPAEIPLAWLQNNIPDYEQQKSVYDNALSVLCEQGFLIPIKQQLVYRFSEELFRVFISLTYLEQQELINLKNKAQFAASLKNLSDAEIEEKIMQGEIRIIDLDQDAKKYIFKRLRNSIEALNYNLEWDAEDLLELSYDDNLAAVVDDQVFDYEEYEEEDTYTLPPTKKIINTLIAVFRLDEIENISYELGIEYEDLPKKNKEELVEYIINYAKKNELMRELVRICYEMYPDLNWGLE